MVFQAAHYNPMVGHLGSDKTQKQIMVFIGFIGFIGRAFGQMYVGGVQRVPNVN